MKQKLYARFASLVHRNRRIAIQRWVGAYAGELSRMSVWSALFVVGHVLAAGTSAADRDEPLLVGKEFSRELEQAVGVSFSGSPLSDSLGRLSRELHMAIVLDRRVDPDQRLKIEFNKVPADEAFKRMANQLRIGVCYVGSVIYFGPPSSTAKLPTLAAVKRDEALRLPDALKQRLLSQQAWQWDELANPRELVRQLVEAAGLVADEEALRSIPHDLWPAVKLPKLPLSDRLTIVLAGFDLTYEVDQTNSHVRFVPVPDQVTYEHTYVVKGDAKRIAADLSRRVPNAKITGLVGKIKVSGLYEDHALIDKLLRGEPTHRREVTDGETRYTLNVENKPFEAIARGLGQKLMMEVEFDPQLGDELNQLVSFQVADATLDQLLQALVKPTGVSYKLQDKTLRFGPARK